MALLHWHNSFHIGATYRDHLINFLFIKPCSALNVNNSKCPLQHNFSPIISFHWYSKDPAVCGGWVPSRLGSHNLTAKEFWFLGGVMLTLQGQGQRKHLWESSCCGKSTGRVGSSCRQSCWPACLPQGRGQGSAEPGWGKAAESLRHGSCQVRECLTEQLLDMQWQLPRPPWLCWLTACLPKGGKAWATLIRCSFGEKWTFCHSSPCGYCKENKRIQSLKKKEVTGYWPACQ